MIGTEMMEITGFMFPNRILLLLRFTTFSLWLIVIGLLDPDFQPGGRYLILLYAILAAVGCSFIRSWTTALARARRGRVRALIGGLGVFPAWLLVKSFSPGVHDNGVGLFLAYVGSVLIETLLPDRMKTLPQEKN